MKCTLAGFVLGLAVAACGPKRAPNGVTSDDAIVYLKSNVADAQVYIDGHFIGPLAGLRGGIAIDPGSHRLELRRDDYFSSYLELDLHRAEHKRLSIELAPTLP